MIIKALIVESVDVAHAVAAELITRAPPGYDGEVFKALLQGAIEVYATMLIRDAVRGASDKIESGLVGVSKATYAAAGP